MSKIIYGKKYQLIKVLKAVQTRPFFMMYFLIITHHYIARCLNLCFSLNLYQLPNPLSLINLKRQLAMGKLLHNKQELLILCILIVSAFSSCSDQNCNDCTGNNAICKSCKANFEVTGSSCTACSPGKFNPLGSTTTCSSCSNGCITCTDASTCQQCKPEYGFADSKCSACPLGSFSDGKTPCAQCSTGCSICSSSTVCTTCGPLYYLSGSACLTSCPNGLVPSQNPRICYSCDSSCLTCSGPQASQCTSCSGNLALTPSGTCSTCPQSFYSSKNRCVICPNSCIQCSSATICTKSSCIAGQVFKNGQCQQCSGGKGSKAGAVETCSQSCGTNCLSCSVAVDNTKTCIQSNCQAGDYLDSSNICVACTSSKGSLAGAVGVAGCSVSCGSSDCVTCAASLTGGKTCVKSSCSQGSYFDQTSFSCQSCTEGKGSAAGALTCGVTCTVANCDSCKADGTSCLSCKAGYSISSGACNICSGDKGSKVGATSCITSCSAGCSGCAFSPSGIQTCLTSSCTKGNYFDNSQLKCVACTGGKGSKDGALTCDIACYTGCSSCKVDSSNVQVCLTSTCPAGTYADDSQSKCTVCPSGKGSADNSIGLSSCFTCDATCSSCFATNSASSCLTCTTPSNKPENGVCTSSTCTSAAKLDSTLNVCYTCNTNCLDCDHIKTSLCITCPTNFNLNPLTKTCVSSCPRGYYALAGNCHLCPPGCSSCQYQTLSSSVVCSGCNTGYYALESTCAPCSPTCTTCTSSNICTACAPDYYLSKTTCYKKCLPGYILPVGSQVCTPCKTGCTSCIQGQGFVSGNCNACSVQTGLSSDGASICGPCLASCAACVNGYYFNQGSFTCRKCPPGSVATNSASSCTICSNGLVPNGDSSSCVPCLSGCSVCVAGYKLASGICTKCNNGLISATGGVCKACPANQISNSDHDKCILCTQKGTVPNADQSACVPCEIKCLVCPINYGYSPTSNTCTACASDSASDGTRLCKTCKPGQIPSPTGTCVNCITECQICAPGFGYNSFSQTCTACPSGFISPGINAPCQKCPTSTPQVPNADLSACVSCPQGYIVSPDLMSCILCTTGCIACPVNYGKSAEGACTPCSTGLSSDGTKPCSLCSISGCSSCPTASNKCSICLPTLYVNADGSACNPCSSATTIEQCSQSSCGGFFFLKSSCISNCTVLSKNITSSKPTNGACDCPSGSVWTVSATFTGCLPCSDQSITQTQCLSSQCSSFLWSSFGQISFCTSCALQGGTKGPYGTCICAKGSYWDANSKYCFDCANAPYSICGTPSSCPLYYLDATLTCQACRSNNAPIRLSSTPQTQCPCATGFVWSSNNSTCIKTICKTNQFYLNGQCKACPILNALQRSKASVANGTVCICLSNYQFMDISGSYACACDNTIGSFDLGNQIGCGPCQKIAGAVAFDGSVNQCTCVQGSSWNSATYRCQCTTPNNFLKFGTICTLCTDPTVFGLLVNPKDTSSCTCDKDFVWSATLAQCICKTANQFYQTISTKKSCKPCDKALTAGTIAAYNQCQCKINQVWDPATQKCKCITGSIFINKACFICTSDPFGVGPANSTTCTCKENWVWNNAKSACLCKANFVCDCSSLPNTGFSPKSLICSSCSSLDKNALAIWPSGQTKCGCNSVKYAWQPSTGTCICATSNPAIPALLINKACVLCDRTVNSVYSVDTSKIPSSSCLCFPNYIWNATKFSCIYDKKGSGVVNLAISGDSTDKSCSAIFNKTVSVSALDNFNCLCAVRTSIFNDLTGQCTPCGKLGSQNSVTCKCATGQAWSVLMMKCISISPPGGLYDNPSYAKCVQTTGLASSNLLAFSPNDSNQVIVSGEAQFSVLASQSPLYAPFAAFKCDCASGFGWNSVRRRCYPTSINNKY